MAEPFHPIKLTDHFFQLGTPYFPGFLSVGKIAMLIDGGPGAVADIIADQISSLDIDPLSIEYLAITHTHADHIGALPRLKKRWPHLKTIAGPRAAKILSNPKVARQQEKFDAMVGQQMKQSREIDGLPPVMDEQDQNFSVDIIADDRFDLDLGNGIGWSATPTPGHAGCQMAYFERHEGTAAIGDAAGFYSPEYNLFWPNYFESLADYVAGIKTVAKMDARCIALGHNGAVTADTKGFLAHSLAATKAYHQELLDRADSGEAIKAIAKDKAAWMAGWAGHMGAVVPMMVEVLAKQSMKSAGEGEIDFNL